MARDKATITVDREKLAEARALLGVSSSSEAIDVALAQLIRRVRRQRDVEAYRRIPPGHDEAPTGAVAPDWTDLADDTHWDALWPE